MGQLEFRDKQMFWYQNMVRYASKHFSAAQVLVLRIAIFNGMGLRMLASVFGGGPRDLPAGEPVRSYARVALWAIGLGRTEATKTAVDSSPPQHFRKQLLVLLGDFVPAIKLAGALSSTCQPIAARAAGSSSKRLQLRRKVVG